MGIWVREALLASLRASPSLPGLWPAGDRQCPGGHRAEVAWAAGPFADHRTGRRMSRGQLLPAAEARQCCGDAQMPHHAPTLRAHREGEVEAGRRQAQQSVENDRGGRKGQDQRRYRDLRRHAVAQPQCRQRRQRKDRDHLQKRQCCRVQCGDKAGKRPYGDGEARPRGGLSAKPARISTALRSVASTSSMWWLTKASATARGPGNRKGGRPVAGMRPCQARRQPAPSPPQPQDRQSCRQGRRATGAGR